MVDLKEKMKANTKQQKKKNKKGGPPGAEGAAQPEINGTPVRAGEKLVTGQEPPGEDEDDEASSTCSPAASPGSRVESNSCDRFLFTFVSNLKMFFVFQPLLRCKENPLLL